MPKKKSSRRAPKRRPITSADLLRFRLVSDPRISPDGPQVVFVHKQASEKKKNEYESNLWMVDVSGGEPRKFTSGGKDSSPRWSPDGSRIAFISGRKKRQPQIYLIDCGGGEASALTDFPEGDIASFCFSPDSRMLAVSFREQDAHWTEEAEKARKEQGLSDPPRVVDDWWYRLDGDGYFLAQRYALFVVDVSSGETRRLYHKDTLGEFTFDFSPDSRELAVATNRDKKALVRPWKDELVRIDVASGRLTPIEGLPPGPKTSPRWSPDGRQIAYASREGKDTLYSVENLEVYLCDAKRGGARSLTGREDYCLLSVTVSDAGEAVFAPRFEFAPDGGRIYMRLGMKGECHLASVPVTGGKVTVHTRGALDCQLGNLSADGKLAALAVAAPTALAEVAVIECRGKEIKPKKLTRFNRRLLAELELSSPTSHWVTAEDGHRSHLWMLEPVGSKRGKKAPAVLEVHGGPHALYGSGFFHEFQLLAAQGYAVFYANPRGSKGYGRDHCAAIRGDWGAADWSDIQAVIRFMQDQPNVDIQRMGVMGGSYGGYMTNWVTAHCHDFAAAISDRCVVNLVSMGGNSDYIEAPDDYFPGNFWDKSEARWRQSPIRRIGAAKTPTLIIHSEGDLRCNVEQSEQLFAALKLLGVPTRFVRYPVSTSHGMSRGGPPDLRIHRLEEILAWWEKYLS